VSPSRLGPLTLLAVVAVAGCGDRPFLRADPPVTSGGFSVALVGQRCRRRVRRDQNGILDLELAMRVENRDAAPFELVPAQIELRVRSDAALPDGHGVPLRLDAHEGTVVRVHFHAWSNARCDEPMSLSLAGALAGGPPLVLSFVPEASDT
jgi:hypothetical protein